MTRSAAPTRRDFLATHERFAAAKRFLSGGLVRLPLRQAAISEPEVGVAGDVRRSADPMAGRGTGIVLARGPRRADQPGLGLDGALGVRGHAAHAAHAAHGAQHRAYRGSQHGAPSVVPHDFPVDP